MTRLYFSSVFGAAARSVGRLSLTHRRLFVLYVHLYIQGYLMSAQRLF